MTPQKYAEWTQHHADLFALRDPSDARLFTLWAPALIAFDFEELRAASLAIATDPSDKARFRTNHLSMLTAHILGQRADAAALARDRQERQFASATCPNCFGTGMVRVPHPRFVVDGIWSHPMAIAVACVCPIGVNRFNTLNARLAETQAENRLLDLAQYEAILPDWREIVAAHEAAQDREHEAAQLARTVDRTAPIDARAIAERMARP